MTEYDHKKKSKNAILRTNETVSVRFPVKKPGPISIWAHAKWDRTSPPDPTKRRVDLFLPNASTPVASITDPGVATVTLLLHQATAAQARRKGMWEARITNLEDSREHFKLSISHTSETPLKSQAVPNTLIRTLINTTIGKIKVHLTDGTNGSYIQFPSGLGVPKQHFTITKFRKKINLPWPIPDITINEHINHINSTSSTLSFKNPSQEYVHGSMQFLIKFEASGHEILGTVPAHLKKMNLALSLGMETQQYRITYNTGNVDAQFPCEVDLGNIPDWAQDPLIGYSKRIRKTVERVVENAFTRSSTRDAITNAIHKKVSPLLGPKGKIVYANVARGQINVKHINV